MLETIQRSHNNHSNTTLPTPGQANPRRSLAAYLVVIPTPTAPLAA